MKSMTDLEQQILAAVAIDPDGLAGAARQIGAQRELEHLGRHVRSRGELDRGIDALEGDLKRVQDRPPRP